jgi:hypothetical protein
MNDKIIKKESISRRILGNGLIFNEISEKRIKSSWEYAYVKGRIEIKEGFLSGEIEKEESKQGWAMKSILVLNHLQVYNGIIKVSIQKNMNIEGRNGFGIAFRYQSPYEYYMLKIINNQVQLWKIIDHGYLIKSIDYPMTENIWYSLLIHFDQDVISIQIDKTKLFQIQDISSSVTGAVCLLSQSG